MMLFDTHAHMDDRAFDTDREELLSALPGQGLALVMNPGCSLDSSRNAVRLAKEYDYIYAAVGSHPDAADEVDEAVLEEYRELCKRNPKVKAIGEIGLDYHYEDIPRDIQLKAFRAQMELARELGLPVIVHERDAHEDGMAVVWDFPEVTGVFHCYSGSAEMARARVDRGWYIGLPGVLPVKNARKAIEVASSIPLALIVLEQVDLSRFAYDTANGTSKILGPLVAGIINGACYSQLVRLSSCSGGTDFVAAVIHKSRPDLNFFVITFALNAFVAVCSYFVYDYKMEPVILCIMYCFMSSTVSARMIRSGRSAVRFEIITDYPQEISKAIIESLHHSATLVPGKGMYKGHETNILICIVNNTQVAALAAIVHKFPNTFAVMSSVSEVMGNFKHIDTHGNRQKEFLDVGDGSGV